MNLLEELRAAAKEIFLPSMEIYKVDLISYLEENGLPQDISLEDLMDEIYPVWTLEYINFKDQEMLFIIEDTKFLVNLRINKIIPINQDLLTEDIIHGIYIFKRILPLILNASLIHLF